MTTINPSLDFLRRSSRSTAAEPRQCPAVDRGSSKTQLYQKYQFNCTHYIQNIFSDRFVMSTELAIQVFMMRIQLLCRFLLKTPVGKVKGIIAFINLKMYSGGVSSMGACFTFHNKNTFPFNVFVHSVFCTYFVHDCAQCSSHRLS